MSESYSGRQFVGIDLHRRRSVLRVLVEAGILHREQVGRWAYFRLVPGALDAAAEVLTTAGTASS